MMNGIDVSAWQDNINFVCVAKDGIEFVIIRAGGSDDGFYKDSCFEKNYAKAKAAGLHVGAYYIVGRNFTSEADGIADAKRFLALLKDKEFDMPVYLDIEIPRPEDRDGITDACIAFCNYLEERNYYVGIYGSAVAGFVDRMDADRLKRFTFWVAQYSNSRPSYPPGYGIWQWTNSAVVSGVNGSVDMDICYNDFPDTIIKYGMNGYKNGRKSNTTLALEVINGEWGNGQERYDRLTAAGYDYDAVQTIVNELMY